LLLQVSHSRFFTLPGQMPDAMIGSTDSAQPADQHEINSSAIHGIIGL
jgi:hypothetical protein